MKRSQLRRAVTPHPEDHGNWQWETPHLTLASGKRLHNYGKSWKDPPFLIAIYVRLPEGKIWKITKGNCS